jgi:hypothetical protein
MLTESKSPDDAYKDFDLNKHYYSFIFTFNGVEDKPSCVSLTPRHDEWGRSVK